MVFFVIVFAHFFFLGISFCPLERGEKIKTPRLRSLRNRDHDLDYLVYLDHIPVSICRCGIIGWSGSVQYISNPGNMR